MTGVQTCALPILSARGIKKPESKTITFAAKGRFEKDAGLRNEVMTLINKK